LHFNESLLKRFYTVLNIDKHVQRFLMGSANGQQDP